MVRTVKRGYKDREEWLAREHRGPQLRTDLDEFYDPDAPMPDEIVEARIDGFCPRCGKKGTFGLMGQCECGFAWDLTEGDN